MGNLRAADVWARYAPQLAWWAENYLVNRLDAWGSYLPLEERTDRTKVVTRTGQLTRPIMVRHFIGADQGDLIGLHTTAPDNTCRWVVIDIDHHGPYCELRHASNREAAVKLHKRIQEIGFAPLLISSNGQGGYHIFVLFSLAVPTPTAHSFARWLVRDWQKFGLDERPESFPKQPKLGKKVRYGNWVRLPGRHHTLDFFSRAWTGSKWAESEEAIRVILKSRGSAPALIPPEAASYDGLEPNEKEKAPVTTRSEIPDRRRLRTRPLERPRPVDAVLSRLKNVTSTGSGWSARCPGHRDHRNSLSVAEADDGRVLLFCHAGCDIGKIVDALQIRIRDLFDSFRVRRPVRHRREER